MYKNSILDNPIVIFSLLIFVGIVNVFLPVHFLSLLLIGVIYTAFTKLLEKEDYTSLSLMIVAFSIIELAQGLKLFSLSLLAFFIYIFIAPRLKNVLSSTKIFTLLIVFIFYIGTVVLFSFLGEITYELAAILLINYFIDILILAVLL
jgi:hypothetical protein